MANAENKLKGNYYVAWLSRCDSAWRRLLADRGPYVSQYQLKKEHHDACQTIAKDLLWSQFNDWKRGKKYGPKANPRRSTTMKRRRMRNMSPSALKYRVKSATPGSQFFDRQTMKFFGDSMRNYGVRRATISVGGVPRLAYELYRKRPVEHGLQASAYFDAATFKIVRPDRSNRGGRRYRRNRSHAQKQARHYKLAQRRGRLGFLRRLKGRANARGRNPYYRTADGVLYRSEPASRTTQRLLGWRRMSKKELQQYVRKWEEGVPLSPFYKPSRSSRRGSRR